MLPNRIIKMTKYYSEFLSAERLKLCYDLAPPRVKQYLNAEIDYVKNKIKEGDYVLELGCGYGRILKALHRKTKYVFGIDLSLTNLVFGQKDYLAKDPCHLSAMDAFKLGFRSKIFDLVFCIQNGVSAFGGNPGVLIKEAIRVTKQGGLILFSSYSNKFWDHRLKWFQIQSNNKLIGKIDYDQTGNGVIVCKDGFKASTFNEEDFISLTSGFKIEVRTFEVDESSVFCEITI